MDNKKLFAIVTKSDNKISLNEMRRQDGGANDHYTDIATASPKVISVSFARYTEFEISTFSFHPRYTINRL